MYVYSNSEYCPSLSMCASLSASLSMCLSASLCVPLSPCVSLPLSLPLSPCVQVIESPNVEDLGNMPDYVISELKHVLKKESSGYGDNAAKAFLLAMVSMIGGYRKALKFREVGVGRGGVGGGGGGGGGGVRERMEREVHVHVGGGRYIHVQVYSSQGKMGGGGGKGVRVRVKRLGGGTCTSRNQGKLKLWVKECVYTLCVHYITQSECTD